MEKLAEESQICRTVTMSTTNPIYTTLVLTPGLHGERAATNRVTYDTPEILISFKLRLQ